MKKAFEIAALVFVGISSVWTLLELLYLQVIGGDFVTSCTHPFYLILCGGVSAFMAVTAFLNQRSKTRGRGTLVIR